MVARVRGSTLGGGFLDGLNAASLSLMMVVTGQLARSAITDVPTVCIAACAAALLLPGRVNATWVVAGGALAGLVSVHF